MLSVSAPSIAAPIADSGKTVLTLNWSWPNYATDSANQKFVIQIDSAGHNFAKPATRVVKGVLSTSFTAKELNLMLFGFNATKSVPNNLDVRVISSYNNNNDLYQSNTIKVSVTPYIIPVTLALNPVGPLTLLMINATSTAVTCNWNATQFGDQSLNYAIQIQKSGGTWTNVNVKPTGTALTTKYTVSELNGIASIVGIPENTTGILDLRVIAYQGTNYSNPAYSDVVSQTVTTYRPVIYALGDGTTAVWDNTAAIQMDQSSTPGVFVATLDLTAEKSLKFIQTLGSWTPQWGQASGKPAGTLGVNLGGGSDPEGIPVPKPSGKYKVTVDIINMTYTVVPAYPAAVYMIGDGVVTSAGNEWNWTIDLPMIPVNSHPNLFWKITWMKGSGGFKVNSAKAWDGNELGTNSTPPVAGVYNLVKGDNIPVPLTAGYYMVVADFATGKIAIADPKVYLIGSTIDSWNAVNPAGLFTVDNANSLVTITKTLAGAEIRMYAWHPWFTDWWQSEFIILNGKIEFRGTGGDQARVLVTAGEHKIDLNFKTGDGAIN